MPIDTIVEIHDVTARMSIHAVAGRLVKALGPTLVATLAGVKDAKIPYKWAKADGPTPRAAAQQRLTAAHRVWVLLSAGENEHVARGWFIGCNPRLAEKTPVMALRDGQIKDVIDAATAFVEGTD